MKQIFILFFSSIAFAETGIDTLALPRYVDEVKENLPNGWWFSSFAETFGDGIKAVEDVNSTGKPKGFRIHLIWDDSHSYGEDDIEKIVELSKRVEIVAKRYPKIKCEISPFCEHNIEEPDLFLELVEKNAPSCIPVNTVLKGRLSKRYKNEIHGNNTLAPTGKYNWSADGENYSNLNFSSLVKKYNSAEVFWIWKPELNGLTSINDKTPIDKRNIWATKEDLNKIFKSFK